jgi:hypothetical protein
LSHISNIHIISISIFILYNNDISSNIHIISISILYNNDISYYIITIYNLDDTTMTTMTDLCFRGSNLQHTVGKQLHLERSSIGQQTRMDGCHNLPDVMLCMYMSNTCLPTNPHSQMPQYAGSDVMYVYVKHFCASFCARAVRGPRLYTLASRCKTTHRRTDVKQHIGEPMFLRRSAIPHLSRR